MIDAVIAHTTKEHPATIYISFSSEVHIFYYCYYYYYYFLKVAGNLPIHSLLLFNGDQFQKKKTPEVMEICMFSLLTTQPRSCPKQTKMAVRYHINTCYVDLVL
jgi:hypothetical protein